MFILFMTVILAIALFPWAFAAIDLFFLER